MEEGSSIGHLNVCKGLDSVHLCAHASIAKLNWITGFPKGNSRHFSHQPERRAELIMGAHSAIASRHLIDCTATVTIGCFTTLAGFRSQILTHSIDLNAGRQSSEPIEIGDYCFVGTESVCLGGSGLPHHSVLGAKSLLNKKWKEPFYLYGGVPAKPLKRLPDDLPYFRRETGFVW